MPRVARKFSLTLLLTAFLGSLLIAEEDTQSRNVNDPANMRITPLQERASQRAEQNDFIGARPFLQEIANRWAEGTEEEQKALGDIYFFLALSFLQEYSNNMDMDMLSRAVGKFNKAEQAELEEDRLIDLLEYRGDSLRGLGRFDEATKDYLAILDTRLNRTLRPERLTSLMEKLSYSLHSQRNWELGEIWFARLLENAETDERRALAAGLLLEAYIEQDKLSDIIDLLPLITVDNPSRYNVSLNVALMRAGDRLADRGNYAEATLLYNATLNREQIMQYFENEVKRMERHIERMREIGLSEERLANELFDLGVAQRQLEAVRNVAPYTAQLMARVARNYYLAGRDYEALWAYLRLVNSFPDDPSANDFEFAAFIIATRLGMDDLARNIGERFLIDAEADPEFRKRVLLTLATAYLDADEERRFLEVAYDFSSQFPDTAEAAQIVFMLGNYMIEQGRMEDLREQMDRLEPRLSAYPAAEGIFYWKGLSYLFEMRFRQAQALFQRLVSEHPEGVYTQDAKYRYAITYYGMNDMDGARNAFASFIELYPEARLRGEVEFFLGEIAASEGYLEDALEHYSKVPEFTDNMSFITSSYFQRAKLLERNARFQEAIDVYEEYIDEYGVDGRLTEAIYLLGELLKSQGRPGEAITRYYEAILEYGNDHRNLGVDSMIETYVRDYGKIRDRLQQTVEFLNRLVNDDEFRKEVARSRGFLYQQFVDNPAMDKALYERLRQSREFSEQLAQSADVVRPILEEYRTQLNNYPRQTPEQAFLQAYNQMKRLNRRTIAFRMQMALEELGRRPSDPMVIVQSDFLRASPAMLVWMGNSLRRGDPEMAEQAFRMAIDKDELDVSQVEAYMALGRMLEERGDLEEAMAIYDDALANFPAHPDIYRALISQARILSERRRPEEARDKLLQILKTPDWRGEPHAQALYLVGNTYFDEGKYPEAHGYFERTFLGYSFFREWAARAYLMDAKTLYNMGEIRDARNTINEALSDDRFEDTEIYSELVQYANSI